MRTGGLSYEEFGDLSAEIAARGIAGKPEQIKELYTQMGFDPSHFEAVYKQIENLEENFEGLSQQALEVKLAE
jgi:hypothetical protein